MRRGCNAIGAIPVSILALRGIEWGGLVTEVLNVAGRVIDIGGDPPQADENRIVGFALMARLMT
jgi:hypothetical protein